MAQQFQEMILYIDIDITLLPVSFMHVPQVFFFPPLRLILWVDSERHSLPIQVLTMSYPHVFTVSKSCTCAATRQAMEAKFNSRCIQENAPLLEQITALRHRIAQVGSKVKHE